ncbi:hypothetical protein Tco_0404848 [Tanacetum coccineum]
MTRALDDGAGLGEEELDFLPEIDLHEIIEEGNSFKPVARTTTNEDGTSTTTIPGVVTAEQKILKKNDLKARSILMMTLPSEHLLTFNKHKDAKSLFEAIEARICAMLAIDGTGFDWSYMADKVAPTNFALMAFSDSEIVVLKRDASFNESDINALKKQVERLKKEKEGNQFKIDNFENASKSLDQLIGNQIFANNKKGLGYNVVPPPLTGLFAPPSIDLSNSGLEKFKQPKFEGYGVKVNKGASENVSKEVKKTLDAPIIED